MRLKFVLLLLALFCCRLLHTNALAQVTPQWQWAKSGGGSTVNSTGGWGTSGDEGRKIAIDADLNSYVIGVFYDSAVFDTVKVYSGFGKNVFLAKYGPNGKLLWAQSFKSNADGYFTEHVNVATDAAGNVYASFLFPGSVQIGSVSIKGSNVYDYCVAKFTPSGALIWAKTIPSSLAAVFASNWGSSMAVTSSGVIHLIFNTTTLKIDTVTAVTPAFTKNAFLVQLNPQGELNWIKSFTVENYTVGNFVYFTSVVLDDQDNIFLTGRMKGRSLQVGGKDYKFSTRQETAFLCKLNKNAQVQWAQKTVDTAIDITGIAVDGSGNCFGTGILKYNILYGNDTIKARGRYDIVTFRHNSAGVLQWMAVAGGDDPQFDNWTYNGFGDLSMGIAADKGGNCYITGSCLKNAVFDSISFPGEKGAFVASYNAHGKLNFFQKTEGGVANALALSDAGDVFITGFFEGKVGFGTDTVATAGIDVFVAKLKVGIIAGTKAERQQPELYLYPNPVRHTLHIRLPEQHNVTHLRLLNLNGQLVREVPVQQEAVLQLPVQGLAKGLYLLQVHGNGEVWHRKVVVE